MLDHVFPQFASRLIRNGATLGGNLGTGSPIGDTPPACWPWRRSSCRRRPTVSARSPGGTSPATARPSGSPASLIKSVRIPLPLAEISAFHKIAKRRFDDISSVAVGFAIEVVDGEVVTARIGLGGVAATPIRALDTEAALEGRPWSRETVRVAAGVLRQEGTPIDDQRATADYRAAMLGTSLPRAARQTSHQSRFRDQGSTDERPVRTSRNPVVGEAIPHECVAARHRAGPLHRRPGGPHEGLPARIPRAGLPGPRDGDPARRRSGARRARGRPGAHGRRRTGVNDAGIKHDEPLFPTEVCYFGHPVAWVLGETLEAARLGAAAVVVEADPLPALVTVKEAIAAKSPGSQPHMERGDVEGGLASAAHMFCGEFEFAGQEHFYLETHAALALVDENGQIFVQSSTQHPSETQEIVAHVLGRHSHDVTVQWPACGGFGGKEMQPHGYAAIAALGSTLTGRPVRLRLNRTMDMTMSGKRHGFHAEWRVGSTTRGRCRPSTRR